MKHYRLQSKILFFLSSVNSYSYTSFRIVLTSNAIHKFLGFNSTAIQKFRIVLNATAQKNFGWYLYSSEAMQNFIVLSFTAMQNFIALTLQQYHSSQFHSNFHSSQFHSKAIQNFIVLNSKTIQNFVVVNSRQ